MRVISLMEQWVARGQDKIGAYDKQLWEKSVEERVLKNIAQVPKKNARVKAELIDVDLVRGSTFTKAKPQHGWLAVSRMGLLRLFLLPVFFRWWENQTTRWFTVFIFILYMLQVGSTAIYVTDNGDVISNETLSLAHVTTPWVLMLLLGLMHAQIVATRLSHKHHHRPKTKRRHNKSTKCKRKVRSRFTANGADSASQETGQETYIEEESSGSRERRSSSSRRKSSSGRRKGSPWKEQLHQRSRRGGRGEEQVGREEGERSAEGKRGRDKMAACNGVVNRPSQQQQLNARSGATTAAAAAVSGGSIVKQVLNKNTLNQVPSANPHHALTGEAPAPPPEAAAPCDRARRENRSAGGESSDWAPSSSSAPVYVDSAGGGVSACTAERTAWSGAITEFSGELIIPPPAATEIRLTDDLIIPCDCAATVRSTTAAAAAAPGGRSHGDSMEPWGDDSPYSNAPARRQSVGGGAYPPTTLCSDEGISEDLPPRGTLEDKSPTEDFSISSNGSDSLLFETRKPPPPSPPLPLLNDDAGGSPRPFPPPIIVRTDGDGGATNEETDSEISCSRPEPEMTLRRRRRGGDVGAARKSGDSPARERLSGPELLTVRVAELKESTGLSSCDSEQDTAPNTPVSLRGQTSEYEWEDAMHSDVTSTDTSSCSSESDSSNRDDDENNSEDPFHGTHLHSTSSVMNNLASSSDKVSCMIWEDDQVKKVDLTVLDIGWTIIQKVDKIPQMCDYVVLGLLFAVAFTLMPIVFRSYHMAHEAWPPHVTSLNDLYILGTALFGNHWRIQLVILNGSVQRLFLSVIFFFLLSVADRTFKQRLLYAKNFCYLTSSRRARKYELPHFRLNKVRNIKTWLSLRSYLKKRGPQRSIDTIVSAAFILAVIFVSLMCLKLLQDSGGFLDHLGNWELVGWCMALAIYLLRFMTIGTKINRKYRNFSVLITEQINLYLHMEQKPHKKDELMLANSVLKLAEDLLKELESPFKISGLSANPFLYNVTKVIVLSAFSAVLTELLGFKLKLYKIKLRP